MDLPNQMDLCYIIDWYKAPELLIFQKHNFTTFLMHLSILTGKYFLFSSDWPSKDASSIYKIIVAHTKEEALRLEKELIESAMNKKENV